ncbi:MAG: amino acid adenylation domain-containing protein, partial [Sterolibacterium sp.]|nr:amino acid adenylation domain-containing protein [Sterolibacterium sp.]
DLSLNLQEHEGQLHGELQYATDLFDATTIRRWIGHFRHLLQGMLADESQPIHHLPLLDAEERRQLLEDFNTPAWPLPPAPPSLVHGFEAQVRQQPAAEALLAGEESLNYRTLNAQANQLAHHLRRLGIRAEERVALCIERSPTMIVALLGILKAGAAYIPLDPRYPQERLDSMLADAKPALVLGTQALLAPLSSAFRTLALDETATAAAIAAEARSNPTARRNEPQAHHLAYIMYTSGSTGQPKGVMLEHRGLVNLVNALQQHYLPLPAALQGKPHQRRRLLQFASLSFDMSVEEIFGALCNGLTLVLRDDDWLGTAATFWQRCAAAQINILNLPTAFWQILVQDTDSAIPPCVRQIFIGGEAVNAAAVQHWFQRDGHRPQLLNAYGPTETSVNASIQVLEPAPDTPFPSARLIGTPIANTRAYLLDPLGQPVPIGVSGELFLGGIGVARGYFDRPELTAERFIADPFSPDPSEPKARLYKTGDLARWRPDGRLEYLGRNDFQLKIRGFRIEPGEIEARLTAHPAVQEAVVIAREEASGERRLVAYLTGNTTTDAPTEAIRTDDLRQHLQQQLPDYMVPAAFVVLPRLPRLPNGKLDRTALPTPSSAAGSRTADQAPRGEIEETLAVIWQDLLQAGQIGRHDHFFELGGHSLLVVQMLERLRQQGLPCEVRSVFQHPTVAALAAVLASTTGASKDSADPPFVAPANRIPPGCTQITPELLPLIDLSPQDIEHISAQVPGGAANIQDIYPLAPLQEGLLFHHRLSAENRDEGDAYVLPTLLRLDSADHCTAFLEALRQVIARHDILRSAVLWEGLPRPLQVVLRTVELPIEHLPEDGAQDTVTRLRARMSPRQQYLDVRQAPLIRITQANEANGPGCALLLQLHHLISDHVSLELAIEEIMLCLAGQIERLPPPQPYRHFIAQLQARFDAAATAEFFRARLADIDEPTAPFGLLDVHGDGQHILEASQPVTPALAVRLRQQSRRLGLSPAALFHAAWALVVGRTSGRDRVVFGSVLSGRLQGTAGADRALGMFINTLPLRFDLAQGNARTLVDQAHHELVELLRHEQAPLALAQRTSPIPAGLPLFTAVLNYRHSSPTPPAEVPGIAVLASQERTNYPFVLSVDDLGDAYTLTAQSDPRVPPARLAAYLHTALEHLTDALERNLPVAPCRLPVLPDEECRHLAALNPAPRPHRVPKENTPQLAHQFFEACARQHPDLPALLWQEQPLSYLALNQQANRLARHLQTLGIHPQPPSQPQHYVAFCCTRGPDMIVALLAILKAGAAYLPIDPDTPHERLADLLADARPTLLLSQRPLLATLAPALAVYQQAGGVLLALDDVLPRLAELPADNLDMASQALAPDSLAYVIYTSGSTGRPKGVLLEHRGLVNLIRHPGADLRLKPGSRLLQFASPAFDAATWEWALALSHGATLCLAERHALLPGRPLQETLQQQAISHALLPPVALQA